MLKEPSKKCTKEVILYENCCTAFATIPQNRFPKQEMFTTVVGCNGLGLSMQKPDPYRVLLDMAVQCVSMVCLGDLNQ